MYSAAAAGHGYALSPSSPFRLACPPASRPTMAPSSSRSPLAATPIPTRVVEDEGYGLPPFSSNAEILRYLDARLKQYRSSGQAGVSARLPSYDPWNIPGMPHDEGESKMREKYYVTDCSELKSSSTNPATQTGYWKARDNFGWGIPPSDGIGPAQVNGLKMTYDFHIGQTIYEEASKGTSWIMDVYFLINHKDGYHQLEDDLVICHVFKGNSRDYDPRPKCAHHHHESPKEKGSLPYHFQEQSLLNQCDPNQAEILAQSNNALLERPAGSLATRIDSNKHVSPPEHAPQIECVSHHQASKENGSLAAHHQGFQLPNHGCNQNTGEPNQQVVGQNNDHFDMGLLPEVVLNSDMEEVTDHTFVPISTYFSNLEGVTDTGAFLCQLPNDIADENTGIENSMEMINYDMPNGVSSTVSASAENGPLGKRARTKSSAWNRFTKLFTKAKAKLAVCNHCYKVLTGDSKNGTSHLKRHKCHCNHC